MRNRAKQPRNLAKHARNVRNVPRNVRETRAKHRETCAKHSKSCVNLMRICVADPLHIGLVSTRGSQTPRSQSPSPVPSCERSCDPAATIAARTYVRLYVPWACCTPTVALTVGHVPSSVSVCRVLSSLVDLHIFTRHCTCASMIRRARLIELSCLTSTGSPTA